MRKSPAVNLLLLLLLPLLLAACAPIRPAAWLQGPTPIPGAGEFPLPMAEVQFTVQAPQGTPAQAELAVEFVDPVTGVSYNPRRAPLSQEEAGVWQARLSLPVGSLIRYRYLQIAPETLHERTSGGEIVRYRVASVPGAMQLEDTIASWQVGGAESETGRVLGRVATAGAGQAVGEMIVTAAGQQTFSDGEGRFRIEGLVPGLHNIVVYHPDGAYQVAQQGAIVAEGSTTPAEFTVEPAAAVTLTFQVEVPPGTPAEGVPRMAGNVRSLGAVFAALPGDVEVSAARMPELVRVDETHFLGLFRLHAGTDLRYKYSLGDGLWNAERDAEGAFVTRQLVVPETETTIENSVASWETGAEPLSFAVETPLETPAEDEIGLQLNPFTPFEPLPMEPAGDNSWSFELYGPLGMAQSLAYRYCRNLVCPEADEAGIAEATRTIDVAEQTSSSDSVSAWPWWSRSPEASEPELGAVEARGDFAVGVDLAPTYRPAWVRYEKRSAQRIAELGANRVTFTPTWRATGDSEHPRLEFDPTYARFTPELAAASAAARELGLSVVVRPELSVDDGWWTSATRNTNWWTTYFEELRSFLLTQARFAEEIGADQFVLTGAQLAPALPGGSLPDGRSSEVPADAFGRWTSLLRALRETYSGDIGFEAELRDDLYANPGFMDQFDVAHVYWHAPLTEAGQTADPEELRREAQRYLDLEVLPALPPDLPVHLSVEYLSVEGSASACVARPDRGCLPPEAFDAGAVGTPGLAVDLQAQAEAIQAVLAAAAVEERIEGFSTRRFNPLTARQDKSASVHGKLAGNMLEYWYMHLRGE